MVDAVMDKTAYARLAIAAQAIRVNNAIRHDFLFDNRHQSIELGIIYDNGIDPSVSFQDTDDNRFPFHTATMSTFPPSTEMAFVQFDRAIKNLIGSEGAIGQDCRIRMGSQNIGSGTDSTFRYKKWAVLSVLFSLICSVLSSYFKGSISAHLYSPKKKAA